MAVSSISANYNGAPAISFHAGDYATAESYLKKALELDTTFSNYLGHRAAFYPEALYYQAVIFEKMGQKQKPEKSFSDLVELWKNADSDLHFLKQAKSNKER
jgi:tetratricopeptide (TPR) repeat protein